MLKKGFSLALSIFLFMQVWVLAMASDRPDLKKTDLPKLGVIPREVSIILAAPWAGGNNPPGRLTNELFVIDDQGGHKTRITFNGKSYNHFAVAPGRGGSSLPNGTNTICLLDRLLSTLTEQITTVWSRPRAGPMPGGFRDNKEKDHDERIEICKNCRGA